MKETELAEIVISWLENQHWDIYQEVCVPGGVIDILAVRNNRCWAIETKTKLSLTVMDQAFRRTTHYRSVAVPRSKYSDHYLQHKIAKNYLYIGVLEINPISKQVEEIIEAKLMREYNFYAKNIINKLTPEQKTYAKAGTNNGGYYTPYRQTIDEIKTFLRRHPGSTIKDIVGHLDRYKLHHYASPNSAKQSIKIALNNWESETFRKDTLDKKDIYFVR